MKILFKILPNKSQIIRFFRISLVTILMISWVFSGWPRVFNFPPRVEMARAAITYVGGQVGSAIGVNGNTTVTFSLTNGSNSTPQAGDLVVIAFSNGDTTNKALTIKNASAVAYTYAGGSDLYQDGTSYDSNFVVGYRFMPATPDASALLAGGDNSGGRAWSVHVFRGIDQDTPLDVAAVPGGGTGTHLVNPEQITPVTSGALIYVGGAGATATGANFAAAYLTDFRTANGIDTQDGTVGAGYVTWSSGTYDPVAFTGGGTNSTADSWNSITLALRPIVPAVPTVTTPTQADISYTSATLGANVTSLGEPASISERGTCWGTSNDPTTNCVAEGNTILGAFTQNRTGLSPGTLYYYRGYADNSTGRGYSISDSFTTLTPTDSDSALEVHADGAQANLDIVPTNDTSGEKFSVLKFQVSDKATADSLPTLIDQITIPISGTGANASTDIAWAELWDDTNNAQVATAASITNSAITFGSTPNSGGTAGLDTVSSASTIKYSVRVYMKNSQLTATDGLTYVFAVNDSNIGTDTSTAASSQMRSNASAVSNVTGTINVAHSQLIFSTQPPAVADINVDFTGDVVVAATDANLNIDTNFSEGITLSAVIDTTHAAPSGVLSSTDSGGLTKSPTNGIVTWADIKYSVREAINLKAVSTSYSSGIFSSTVTFSAEPDISLVQEKGSTQEYVLDNYSSISVTLDTPATAGNLLITAIGTDKSAGSYTVPNGFTLINDKIGASVSGAMAYKIAVGGETSIEWQTSAANGGSSVWVGEYFGTSDIVLDQAAENETTGETSDVTSISTGVTAATTKNNELAVAMMTLDTSRNGDTGRSWSNSFSETFFSTCIDCGQAGLSVATKNLTSIGTQSSTYSTSGIGDQMYAAIATFKTVPGVILSSSANQTFITNSAATPITTISITDNSDTPVITDTNNIRIRIPASFNMTWDTSDTLANIGGTNWAKTGAASSGGTVTVTYEDNDKTVVIPVTSDFASGDYITVYGLSVTNFSAVSGPDNLELVVSGTGGSTADEDAKTITVIEPSTIVSSITNAPVSFKPDTAAQYFGTYKFDGVGTVSGLTLTQYGNDPSPEYDLINVKLIQDDGDGSFNPSNDTVQLGSTATFNESGVATFSNFSLSAGSTSFVHIVLDVTSEIIPLPAPTVGLRIVQSSHVTSSVQVSASSWPIQTGLSTLSAIYPYLLDASQTSIKVYWLSSSNSVGTVEYGTTASYGSSVNDSGSTAMGSLYIHKATLTGLSTSTLYHYKVSENGITSSDATFSTAPAIGSAFDFMVMADLSEADITSYTSFYEAVNNVANASATLDPKKITLMVGDHQQSGATTEWNPMFFLPSRNILKNSPFYHAPGNHDYYLSAELDFNNLFDAPTTGGSGSNYYYSFDYGNIHFVFLDGNQSRAFGSAQYNWLKTDMATAAAQDAKWRILATHQPGLAYGGGHASDSDNGFMAAITSLGSEAGVTKNFDLILMGHNHNYERSYRPETNGGIVWVTVGRSGGEAQPAPACKPGDATCPYLQFASAIPYRGFMKFSSTADNLIGTYYELDLEGKPRVTPRVGDIFILPVSAKLSSTAKQKFEVGDSSRLISTITVSEMGTIPVINTTNDIRIKIPANLYMTWDTSDTLANIAGSSWAKTGAASSGDEITVTYEDAGKTLVIPVTSNFAALDNITIYGLSFNNFTGIATGKALELEVDNAGNTISYDNQLITINPSSDFVQDASFSHDYLSPTSTITTTLSSAATANNLLVAAIATDKDSGTYTVPSGFTRIGTAYNSANVSCDFAYKIATGGETGITWTYTDATKASSMWVGEYTGNVLNDVLDTFSLTNSGANAVQSQSTGLTSVTAQAKELAVAFFGIDSAEYAGGRIWTNNFSEVGYSSTKSTAGLGIAHKFLTATSTQETTVSWEPTTDQVCAGIATFKLQNVSSLTFSISDDSIGFGNISSTDDFFATGNLMGSSTEVEAHTISASTNVSGGYVMDVSGDTLTNTSSSTITISAIGATSTASVVGSEQFGLRLTVNSGTGTVSSPYNTSGFAYDATASTTSIIATGTGDDTTTIFSLRYLSNISNDTETGSYSTTLTYKVTAAF